MAWKSSDREESACESLTSGTRLGVVPGQLGADELQFAMAQDDPGTEGKFAGSLGGGPFRLHLSGR